jgi:thioredoxin
MMDLAAYNSLINIDSLVLIDFYAPWCAPCRKMMPMIDSLKTEYHGSVNILKINADASKKLIKELKIESVPYFALYRNGMQLFSHYGIIDREELVKRLNQHIVQ